MATITIFGTAEENEKIENLLKRQFDRVIKKANAKCSSGEMLVLDAYTTDHCEINGFTDEQILKAMRCCSDKERNCEDCPYSKEKDCITKLQMDGALIVHRMHVKTTMENREAKDE